MDTNKNSQSQDSVADKESEKTYASVLSKTNENTLKDTANNNPLSDQITNGNDTQNKSSNLAEYNNSPMNSSYDTSENSEDTDDSQLSFNSAISKNATLNESSELRSSDPINLNDEVTESSSPEVSSVNVDLESEDDDTASEGFYQDAIKQRFHNLNNIKDLPETVCVLETSEGSKVFLVGTAHFSIDSQEDVKKVIRAVQPDCVLVELCKSRTNILSLDEETILEEAKGMNFQKIKLTLEQNGVLQGLLYLLMLNMSVYLTKQLGMAPGGEFRRAYTEAQKVPGCIIHLGDRPIHITLQRAFAKLTMFQKLKLAYYMLHTKGPVSQEEVERCKQKDLIEELLEEMTGEFPEISEVFVRERDIYLTYSLQVAASMQAPRPHFGGAPRCIVGVVGIGHVPGIKKHWGKVTDEDIPPILCIPEPSLTSKIVRQGIRITLLGVGLYGAYKLLPNRLKMCFGGIKSFAIPRISFKK